MVRRSSGRRRGAAADGGFGTVEVIVALMVLGIAMGALTQQTIGSMRASSRAKLTAQAKGVAHGQLDAMRTLAFQVGASAGAHVDLLDRFYPDTRSPQALPSCTGPSPAPLPRASWVGYVPAAGPRCAYEPAGAFYRQVLPPGGDIPAGFTVSVATQFVSSGVTPVPLEPAAGYDTSAAGRDRGPSAQVGVTLTVLHAESAHLRPYTVYSQIAARAVPATRVRLQAQAATVEIGSSSDEGQALTLTVGQLALAGDLTAASTAKASLTAIGGSGASAGRHPGAEVVATAPFTSEAHVIGAPGATLGTCAGPCWSATSLPPFTVASAQGLPRVAALGTGSAPAPVQTVLADAGRDGFQFRAGTSTLPDLTGPLVSLGTPAAGSAVTNQATGLFHCAYREPAAYSRASAAGYLVTTDETAAGPRSAEACAGGRTDVIRVLPTTLAPEGLVRISTRTSVRCAVQGAAHEPSADADYRAEIEYWVWTPAFVGPDGGFVPGSGRYVGAGVVSPAAATDVLAAVPMDTAVSDTRTLGDYLESWRALTGGEVRLTEADEVAAVTVPALVSLRTKPLRAGDPASVLSLAVGAASCRAEDHR